MTTMLRRDSNGSRIISENEVDDVVSHIKVFGGRSSWKVNRDEIRKDVVNSLTKNNKARLIKKDEPDIETRNSKRECNNFRYNREEQLQVKARKIEKERQSIMINSVASSKQSSKIIPGAEEALTVSNKSNSSYKLQSDNFLLAKRSSNDDIGGIQAALSNGTADSPIDIDSILFNGQNLDQIKSE